MTRYPRIRLRSKNEIAKRIASISLPQGAALALLNDVLINFDAYWYDSKRSDPVRGKFVRSAVKSPPLRKLLKLIDEIILVPYDSMVPGFIFGGLSRRSNIHAARHLLGSERGRILLKLDVQSFFEQISERRVFYFFKKCECSVEAARILARLCCVPRGPKGSGSAEKILARGFATSSRLAVWCNLTSFQHLEWKMRQKLRDYDPRIAIYVDDIGISASRVGKDFMEEAKQLAINVLEGGDSGQPLPIHRDQRKTKTVRFSDGAEHLGIKFGRNKLSLGRRARSRTDKIRFALENVRDWKERSILLKKYRAHHRYKRQVETLGENLRV